MAKWRFLLSQFVRNSSDSCTSFSLSLSVELMRRSSKAWHSWILCLQETIIAPMWTTWQPHSASNQTLSLLTKVQMRVCLPLLLEGRWERAYFKATHTYICWGLCELLFREPKAFSAGNNNIQHSQTINTSSQQNIQNCITTYTVLQLVGCCLATKVFIGKLPATREAWVIVE